MIPLTLTEDEAAAIQTLARRIASDHSGSRCGDNIFLATGGLQCERRDKGHTVHEAYKTDGLATHHFTWERTPR